MKDMVVTSICEGGIAFDNEKCFFAPVELEEIFGGEDFSDYLVPAKTELYMLEKEHVYEDHFNWSLRKYDWSAEKWKRMDGASAVYDDPDYLEVITAHKETRNSLMNRGLRCHY